MIRTEHTAAEHTAGSGVGPRASGAIHRTPHESDPGGRAASLATGRRGRARSPRARRLLAAWLIVLALLVLAIAASIVLGARSVTWAEIVQALSGEVTTTGAIAVQERIPRTVFAIVAGAALGVSGALMQAITRNPLAEPGILGINTGAALFVVCGIAFLGISALQQYIWLALAGSAVTAVVVYTIGSLGAGGATPVKLALAGAATAAALSSLVSAVLLPRVDVMDTFRFWQVGSVGRGSWEGLATIAPFLVVAAVLAVATTASLNALAMGDELARGLGVKVVRVRILAGVAAVLLCAVVTAVAGPIGFVGLMIPHVVRLLTGPDLRWVLPLSALGGAALLTTADTIGRLIAPPSEVEAGIVTAFVGAPVLILIARRSKVRQL